jgi:hypothetical protein
MSLMALHGEATRRKEPTHSICAGEGMRTKNVKARLLAKVNFMWKFIEI